MLRKLFLKIWPYAACLFAGYALYRFGSGLNGDVKGLIHNIAAAFFAIPFLYVIYELARGFSQKRLNKEIFDYAKMLIDKEILSIVGQLSKSVYPYEARDSSFQGIDTFLALEKIQIRGLIEDCDYLGFQLFKNWDVTENNLHDIVQNASIVQRLDDEQVITVIALIKSLRRFAALQKINKIYEITDRKSEVYRVQSGQAINSRNSSYPDRHLLLKNISDDKYIVADFGDFVPYQIPNLLNICKIQPQYLDLYARSTSDVINSINRWLNLTGDEFLIDTKTFRIGISTHNSPEEEN